MNLKVILIGGLITVLIIAGAIVVLLAIVTISYEQTIHAYPGGGGAYIVSRDNLGEMPAQIAGAALLTDYILTVSVSISSGVAQITSGFPVLHPYRVIIAVGLVTFMMIVNLRGVKESGNTFAIPTYFFLGVALFTLAVGFYRYFTGSLGMVTGVTPAEAEATQGLTLFLILRAFANGCTALTGVEAISNGIPAFKEPKSHNAGITLIWMSTILGAMFLGITFLGGHLASPPSSFPTTAAEYPTGETEMYLIDFLEIDPKAFEQRVLAGGTDEELLAWVRANSRKPSEQDIAQWSQGLLSSGPKDDAACQRFQGRLQDVATKRGVPVSSLFSVSTWADVIELDEDRL